MVISCNYYSNDTTDDEDKSQSSGNPEGGLSGNNFSFLLVKLSFKKVIFKIYIHVIRM